MHTDDPAIVHVLIAIRLIMLSMIDMHMRVIKPTQAVTVLGYVATIYKRRVVTN